MSRPDVDAGDELRELLGLGPACLVVIDVQNDFCADGGWFSNVGFDLRGIQEAVARLERLVAAARRAAFPVVFVRAIYDEQFLSPAMHRRHARGRLPLEHCRSGTWGADFYRLRPEPGEMVFTKHRYSAFVNTELDAYLRAQRMQTLVLAGITANVCVESTARDGFMHDYDIVVVGDCTATYDPRLHAATLENIERSFGIVVPGEELASCWEPAVPLTVAPAPDHPTKVEG